MKKCLICKKDFENATRKQRFCSNSCRQKNYRKEVKELLAEIRLRKSKIKPNQEALLKTEVVVPKKEETPVKSELTPPAGLSGIDLAIWKAENKNPR